MTTFTKLDQIRKHLRRHQVHEENAASAGSPEPPTGKRVQKNLSILEQDAERLRALAEREGVSQARLLSMALDAYEKKIAQCNCRNMFLLINTIMHNNITGIFDI